MAQTHEEKICKIKCRLSVNEPFFGHLLTSVNILPHENIPKFQLYGNQIYYNIKYVESLDIPKLTTELLHCLIHIILGHFVKRKDRNPKTWDKATDISVNNIIYYEGIGKNITGYVTKYKDKSAENIYNDIKGEEQDYNGLIDTHVCIDDSEAEQETLKNIVEAHAMAKAAGKMPGGFEVIIKNILEPKVNWKELLRKYATECFMSEDYSFISPRKCLLPFGIYCASLMQESDTMKDLVIAVDTSGSITDDNLKEFLGEIQMLHHLSETTKVITFDAIVHDVMTLNIHETFKDVKFKGRGGTDFRPVFKYMEDHKIQPSLMIILTDGYGPHTNTLIKFPVMWCMVNKNYQVPPFGQTIIMEKN